MTFDYGLGAFLAVCLAGYLLFALIRPERF
jgi:K+-transporting ATPase KdpF subunit